MPTFILNESREFDPHRTARGRRGYKPETQAARGVPASIREDRLDLWIAGSGWSLACGSESDIRRRGPVEPGLRPQWLSGSQVPGHVGPRRGLRGHVALRRDQHGWPGGAAGSARHSGSQRRRGRLGLGNQARRPQGGRQTSTLLRRRCRLVRVEVPLHVRHGTSTRGGGDEVLRRDARAGSLRAAWAASEAEVDLALQPAHRLGQGQSAGHLAWRCGQQRTRSVETARLGVRAAASRTL